jgi:hypothetical protein
MAQELVNARRRDEARRWCHEALAAARGAASADEEADALITLGMVEQYDDWQRIDDDAQPHPLALDDNRLNELDEAWIPCAPRTVPATGSSQTPTEHSPHVITIDIRRKCESRVYPVTAE